MRFSSYCISGLDKFLIVLSIFSRNNAPYNLVLSIGVGLVVSDVLVMVGLVGLGGARLSTALATSANATANPYAQALMAAGNPNAMFGQSLGNVFGGLFS